ncbi:hypothetical protein L3X38_000151 (mitochondrion) [Prunus dulcis]|uniref:Uncharacterized protein n=1 Tax=Prunus dulcis TaxID=3755 RepID=A0AAD4YJI1_PRUDU|nr:hypothetical protein L3X38_000151 [Prunus dulcis]
MSDSVNTRTGKESLNALAGLLGYHLNCGWARLPAVAKILCRSRFPGSSPRVSVWCSQAGFSQGCRTVRTGRPLIVGSGKQGKGQALADFLAAHPASDDTSLSDDLPDEEVLYAKVKFPWEMYFDGSLRSGGRDCLHDPRKALLRKRSLEPYFIKARKLLSKFLEVNVEHVPRKPGKTLKESHGSRYAPPGGTSLHSTLGTERAKCWTSIAWLQSVLSVIRLTENPQGQSSWMRLTFAPSLVPVTYRGLLCSGSAWEWDGTGDAPNLSEERTQKGRSGNPYGIRSSEGGQEKRASDHPVSEVVGFFSTNFLILSALLLY